MLAPYLFPHDIYLIRITASTLSLLLALLGSSLLLHSDDFLLLLNLFGGQKLSPFFVQLSLLCFYVQFDCLTSQLLCLLIKQQHSRNILLSSHPFPFDEFHIPLVVIVLLVFQKRILNGHHIINIHLWIVIDVQAEWAGMYLMRVWLISIISLILLLQVASRPVLFRFRDKRVSFVLRASTKASMPVLLYWYLCS